MIRNYKKYHFIYKTTNLLNGKFYIGMHSTDNLQDGYIGSGKRIWYSIKKYGKENFKIEHIEFFPNRDELIQREIELVNEDILKDPLCMNLKTGGDGGFVSKKQQLQISKAGNVALKKLWKKNGEWANKMRFILSQSQKKSYKNNKRKLSYHTSESIAKMKLSVKGKHNGKKNSQFGTCWITNGKENSKIKKQDRIPENWNYGRI